MDIINHYRKHQFLYDCRNSDYINRDLWEHTQRQFAANLKCDGYAGISMIDSILVIVWYF